MTPNVHGVLMELAQRMGGVYAPDLKSPYLAGAAGLTAALLMMAAEESNRAAHRLAEENRAIRSLFSQAASLTPPPALAVELATLARGDDSDLRISALQAANDALRAALIDLHAFVEAQPGRDADALNLAIWTELADSTRRRAFSNLPF